ncbi:MAG TPA: tRNA adenosine(34) deaminase TadA [Candidatus Binatia bacterium]|nr:tRNA adenosine(34) deaminase TadA [Candidatus Binatia bacterium]
MGNSSFYIGPRDVSYMRLALAEANNAAARGEVPVGAVVVYESEIIGRGHNRREELRSTLAHAELLAIEQASCRLGRWRLSDCQLYVTLEPCVMCVGAILQARIGRLVFGCLDPKGGAVESLYQLCDDSRLNHRVPVTGGMIAKECSSILENFFSRLREQKRSQTKAERWPSPAEGA